MIITKITCENSRGSLSDDLLSTQIHSQISAFERHALSLKNLSESLCPHHLTYTHTPVKASWILWNRFHQHAGQTSCIPLSYLQIWKRISETAANIWVLGQLCAKHPHAATASRSAVPSPCSEIWCLQPHFPFLLSFLVHISWWSCQHSEKALK